MAAREGDAGGGVVEERLGGGGGAKVEVGREGSERGEVVRRSHGRLVGIERGSRRRSNHGGSKSRGGGDGDASLTLCNKNLIYIYLYEKKLELCLFVGF